MAREDRSIDGELAATKAANADLERRLAERDAELAAMRNPDRARWPAHWAAADRPTDAELMRLMLVVQSQHRIFRPRDPSANEANFAVFKPVFMALAHLPRLAEGVASGFAMTVWTGRIEDAQKTLQLAEECPVGMMVVACIAAGDVAFTDTSVFPHSSVFVGLGNHVGRRSDPTAWRKVLTTGKTLPATPLPTARQRGYDNPPPVIRNADGSVRAENNYAGGRSW